MEMSKSGILRKAENTVKNRRRLTLAGGLLTLMLLVAGTEQANAQPVRFRYVGGHWSHAYHAGWHRYWGGPSIGFYYAPNPVYVVPGYAAPSYYAGPNFWYSNPSFGLSLNFGGGGGYYPAGGYYRRGYAQGWHGNGGHYYRGARSSSFHGRGGSFHGGGGRDRR